MKGCLIAGNRFQKHDGEMAREDIKIEGPGGTLQVL